MTWICCYDVRSARRRSRLHKLLRGWLRPVQQSVFEGDLSPKDRKALSTLILREIDPERDTVRLYPLCERCHDRVVLLGVSVVVPAPDQPILL